MRVFDDATAGLAGERSLANSAAVLGWPDAHADWVRPGGALYGISVVDGTTGADFDLRPAMTLVTRLIAVNRVRKGERIGYSAHVDVPGGHAASAWPRSVTATAIRAIRPRARRCCSTGARRPSSAACRWT